MRRANRKVFYWLVALLALVMAAAAAGTVQAGQSTEKVHSIYYSARMRRAVKVKKTTIPSGASVVATSKSGKKIKVQYKKKTYEIPGSAVQINGLVTRGAKPYSKATAEKYVNKKGFSSKTGYFVWISTYTQHLYVFKGRARHWKLLKHTPCATGRFQHETPLGKTTIYAKTTWLWFNRAAGSGGCFGMRIRGGAIHSWPYNIGWVNAHAGQTLHLSSEVYGKPASLGCVRVTYTFVKWMYNLLPVRTGVMVY